MVNIIPIVICLIIGYTNGDTEKALPKDCSYNAQIEPCKCHLFHDQFTWNCDGWQITTLGSELFTKLSKSLPVEKKDIDEIKIFNTNIEELPANIFSDMRVREIFISNNKLLKNIDNQAFAGQDPRVFTLRDSPLIQHKSCNASESIDIFAVINKFKSLVRLYLDNINLQTIPGNAFNELDQLESMTIRGDTIKTMGEMAFYALKSLEYLDLSDTGVERLETDVLTFTTNTSQMYLNFGNTPFLLNKNFANNSLNNMGANIKLYISMRDDDKKTWSIIDESIIRPFLTSPGKHNLYVEYTTFNCNDTRNNWLKSEPTLMSKVYVQPQFDFRTHRIEHKPVHCP